MKSRLIATALVCLLASLWAAAAQAQCTLTIPPVAPAAPPGYVCPEGDGTPAAEAWLAGTFQTGVITATLRDANGDPMQNVPWEDISLEYVDFCQCDIANYPVVQADYNTDANGETTFDGGPLAGGTCLNYPTINLLVAGGVCATGQIDPSAKVKSVDMNCDGIVDDLDKDIFASGYGKSGYPCHDLDDKGGPPLLTDWAIMVPHIYFRHECP